MRGSLERDMCDEPIGSGKNTRSTVELCFPATSQANVELAFSADAGSVCCVVVADARKKKDGGICCPFGTHAPKGEKNELWTNSRGRKGILQIVIGKRAMVRVVL